MFYRRYIRFVNQQSWFILPLTIKRRWRNILGWRIYYIWQHCKYITIRTYCTGKRGTTCISQKYNSLITMCCVHIPQRSIHCITNGRRRKSYCWLGDNSDLETITLSPTLQKYVHFFDNYTDERSIKLYGDFNLKTWELSSINGLIMPTMPLVVDEIISEKNNLSLQGLFLCKGTYLVKLADMSLSSLAPIQDMSLSNLELRNIDYTEDTVINDYLIYIASIIINGGIVKLY